MYHNIIRKFQHSVYKILTSDQSIISKVDKVYLSIMQDAKYPFLLISILNADNMSVLNQNILIIEFEISIFTNDQNNDIALKLADQISQKIIVSSFEKQNFILAGIKLQNIKFVSSKDLISRKLTMNYKTLIKDK